MNQQMTNEKEQKQSWLVNTWNFLTQPGTGIKDPGARRQAQLLAALSLLLAVLSIVGTAVSFMANQKMTAGFYLIAPLALASVGTYFLSRSRYYHISVWIIVLALILLGLFGATRSENPVESVIFFSPLAFIIVVGSFTWLETLIFTFLGSVIAILLPLFTNNVTMVDALTIVGQFVTVGLLAVGVIVARKAGDRDRVAEIQRYNKDLQNLTTGLEQRVAERTRDITLASEIGRRITVVHDLDQLLPQAVELIRDRFNLYYTQVYLVDPGGRSLVMRAGTGEAGAAMLRRGHRLPLDLTSLNGTAAIERQPTIVGDTSRSLIFRPNPLLPDTRSEMSIPLISGERVLGVLDLQSRDSGSLSSDNLPAFETLAGQLTTALVNAELFSRVEQTLVDAETRTRKSVAAGWEDYLDAIHEKERVGYEYDRIGVKPLEQPLAESADSCLLDAPISVAGEQIGKFQLVGDRPWTQEETNIVSSVAAQVAQQVENIRLLSQAERFRRETEATLRRLTHEEWQDYLAEVQPEELSFQYNQGEVRPLSNGSNGQAARDAIHIKSQNETIGEVGVAGLDNLSAEDRELVMTISEQLGAHLDNIRLYATAQQELSERQRAELALKESFAQAQEQEHLVRTVIDSTPDWIFIKDQDHRYRLVNQGYANSLHLRTEQFIGKNDIDLGFPEDLVKGNPEKGIKGFWADDRQVMDSGEAKMIERDIVTIDGKERIFSTLKTPLRDAAGQVWGVLAFGRDVTEREQAQETLARRAAQLATVAQVSTTVSTIQSPEEMLQTVVDLTKQSFELYHAHIYLLNESGDSLVLTKGAGQVGRKMVAEGRQIPIDTERSLVARAARSRHGVIANDVRLEPEFLPNPLLPDTRSEMAVPMIAGDRLVGVLDIQDETIDRFTPEDANIMTTLAAQVAIAMQNARSYARAQRQAEREALINAISERIQATNSVENALQVAVREIGRALGAQHTAIRLGLEREQE
jgi:PAS domain S-box-containing protein